MARDSSFQKTWASNPDQMEVPPDNILSRGWVGGAQGALPEAKWENWWHRRVDEALREIEEQGAPKWFGDVTYRRGALAHEDGRNWIAIIQNSRVNPAGSSNAGHWKEVVVDVASAIRAAAPPGILGYFFRSTAPDGWLKADGQAVPVATYPDLADAIQVGSSRNATAEFGYRCTDPLNPSATRSAAGAYIVKPDARGIFMRGLDDGLGLDSGRQLGSTQLGQNESHSHSATSGNAGSHAHTGSAASAGSHGHGASSGSAGGHNHTAEAGTAGSHQHVASTGPAGAHTHTQPLYANNSSSQDGNYATDGYGSLRSSQPNNSSGSHTHTVSIGAAGNHTHAVSIAVSGAHSHSVSVASGGAHSHTVSTEQSGSHSHPVTVSTSGGTEARPRNIALLACIKY